MGNPAPVREGPADPTIPPNWEQGIRGWDGPPLGQTQVDGCDAWFTVRTIVGPRRWGPVVPVGKPAVWAFYKGDCAWDLILVQEGVQKEFVLYEEVLVAVTKCGATTTESITKTLVGPEWRAVRIKKTYPVWQTLETIVAPDPGGLPCGEEVSHQGVPAQVREAVGAQAERGGYERGKEIPVAPPRPKKPAPPPPPPQTGPFMRPLTPPEDESAFRRWFWVWWSLGFWMVEPDPPWEMPGGGEPPRHDLERPEEPFNPEHLPTY